jgi:hypothetical protein
MNISSSSRSNFQHRFPGDSSSAVGIARRRNVAWTIVAAPAFPMHLDILPTRSMY